jgi:Icc-related predicted phosphoesterase
MSLLQAGLQPTFYQFTEASIEVKLSISIKRETKSEGSPFSGILRAFAAPVNFRTQNTYSYSAQGSSVLRATLKPVPPPPRVTPRIVTVNGLVNPPTVVISS